MKFLLGSLSLLFWFQGEAGTLLRTYNFKYQVNWKATCAFKESDYQYYDNLPKVREYENYTYEQSGREYLKTFLDNLFKNSEVKDFSQGQKVNFLIAFVQSLSYIPEKNPRPGYGVEDIKYPIETLIDKGGDCEDLAILLAAMIRYLGVKTVLLSPPGHMAVGIPCSSCVSGVYFVHKGVKYYYVETTDKNWQIGQRPPEFSGGTTRILEPKINFAAAGIPKPTPQISKPETDHAIAEVPEANKKQITTHTAGIIHVFRLDKHFIIKNTGDYYTIGVDRREYRVYSRDLNEVMAVVNKFSF